MKKTITLLITCSLIFMLAGCGGKDAKTDTKNNTLSGVVAAPLNSDGNIEINESQITKDAAFLSCQIEDVVIGLVAVRGTDNVVRVVLGTCQACSPHPDAYFTQNGETFQCSKCGREFHVDTIGQEKDGCNPIIIEEKTVENGVITISTKYLKNFKDLFLDWNGPKA